MTDTFLQMQVFFLISSVGFVVLFMLIAVFLFYLIRATYTLSGILDKIDKDIDKIGDTTKEMIEEIRNSLIFNFLFRKKRRSRKSENQFNTN